jgi:hypothetical protein
VTCGALSRVNASRKIMEHEYEVPAENEVRLFLDVVALFIEATDRYIGERDWDFHNGSLELGSLTIAVKPTEQKIVLNGQVDVPASDPNYVEILGCAVRLDRR